MALLNIKHLTTMYIPATKLTLGAAALETTAVSVLGGGIGLPSFVCKL